MSAAPVLRRVSGCIDLLAIHRRDPDYYPFLLESVARGGPQARYDILFAAPGAHLILDEQGGLTGAGSGQGDADFLDALDRWLEAESASSPGHGDRPLNDAVPFRGGWFIYLGYELAGQLEPRLRLPGRAAADPALPVACAVRVPAAIICDHAAGETLLVAEPEHAGLLDRLAGDLDDTVGAAKGGPSSVELSVMEEPAQHYLASVERIKRYITEGDVFQVNLSRAWRGSPPEGLSPADLYARLRAANPAPFAGLARLPGGTLVSSSPERLVRVRDGVIETRPIAGTRPRGPDAAGDAGLIAELLAHPKERAEHIMLIDLERNDVGRVAEPGSVRVDELMVLESYAHVHHIVSNVRGRLRPGVPPGEVIRAVFPGGTITGCPKVRCMEIIAELEAEARGPYTGSMGYLNLDGSLDLNILIRTLSMDKEHLTLRAGAGIVADSEPQRELEETRAKARGLLLALEHTGAAPEPEASGRT
ncbi:MAG TPA: aminodeoxychorismate synthase component I [Gammaproteobacteria bacterium]|nr:aminodeoxychorismate synthase component I [Gammaproteobacteria bacterium]